MRYLKDKAHTLEIMKNHAAILAPKFQKVGEVLNRELGECGFAYWTEPKGGYFVSLYTMPGTDIRISPSYPPVEELEKAMYVFCICLKLAALEKIMGMY